MAAPTSTAPVTPPVQPSPIMKLLNGLGTVLSDPRSAAVLGFAQGLGRASAPHMLTPVPFGEAMAEGLQGAQAYRQAALANAIQQEAMLPYQVARTHEVEQAVSGQSNPNLSPIQRAGDQALAANIISPGMGSTLYANNPNVVAQKTLAETLNQLKLIPANERAVILARAFGIPAQGTLPEGSRGTPGGGVAPMPGAPVVMAANAANKAGGAAGATYKYNAALHTVTPAAGLTAQRLGPVPGGFRPVVPTTPNGVAQQEPMQRAIGLQMGLTNAAQAAGRPGPLPAQPGTGGLPEPQPPGVGPSGGWPQRTPEGIAPPGSRAAERAAGERNMPAVLAQVRAAQAAPLSGPPVAAYSAQRAIGAQTGVAAEDASKESAAARQQIAVYNQMDQALSQMGPVGAWRDLTTPLGHLANYLGFKPLNIQSAAEFDKYRTQLVGAVTKSVSPRASTQEMDFLARSVPNYNLPGNAAQVLVSELRGLSQYQVVKSNALPVYLQSVASNIKGPYGGTALGFSKWFINNGPSPSAIVLGSVLSSLPPAQAAQYVSKLRSTLTGKHMIRQYERALKFQAQYPGVFKGL